jgi:REP element-mobilizing transposase RayT
MILNEMRKIVYKEIKNIPDNRENVYVDKFVVMPNHVHMILVVDDGAKIYNNDNDRDAINRASTNPTKNNTHKP